MIKSEEYRLKIKELKVIIDNGDGNTQTVILDDFTGKLTAGKEQTTKEGN